VTLLWVKRECRLLAGDADRNVAGATGSCEVKFPFKEMSERVFRNKEL